METSCSRFTAAEGGTRLAAAAATKNILVVEYASFIPVRLLYEKAYQIRGSLLEGRKRSVYITRASRIKVVGYEIRLLTDLAVCEASEFEDVSDWTTELDKKEVFVCTSAVLKRILHDALLTMSNINVIVLDSCHMIYEDCSLQYIMQLYKQCNIADRPSILALTYPLFTTNKKDIEKLTSPLEEKGKDMSEKGDTRVAREDRIKNVEHESSVEDVSKSREENRVTEGDGQESITDAAVCDSEGNDVKCQIEIVEVKKTEADENNRKDKESVECKEVAIKGSNGENNKNGDVLAHRVGEDDQSKEKKENVASADKREGTIGVYENLDDFDMYEKLEWKIEDMESELCCEMDLAEDIDGGKRLLASITKPRELIIEYSGRPSDDTLPEAYRSLDMYMRNIVYNALQFIEDHRHDPTEIYGEELYEEFMNIPDPAIDPKHILNQFLYVLDQLGPYAADKAAFSLLTKLEKLKIKVPYERHFLLLCLCTTVLVKIRCYADAVFTAYENDWDKIKAFCTPKVLRFAEILEKFNPSDMPNNDAKEDIKISEKDIVSGTDIGGDIKPSSTARMLSDIDECDFNTLGNRIQDRVNTYEANLKDIDDIIGYDITPQFSNADVNIQSNTKENTAASEMDSKIIVTVSEMDSNQTLISGKDISEMRISGKDISEMRISGKDISELSVDTKSELTQKCALGFSRRTGHRARGRNRHCRKAASRGVHSQQSPDALCAIVYMKEPLVANIMFMLLVDMSRCNTRLSYLCAQYCATEQPADPGTEPKECQRQGKKQEEVLKKFRMHECNLLLATSALEEGIDLPRCNLVLRWDVPPSYRSYGVCRGRARASRATAALLCTYSEATTDKLLHNLATYRELDQIITRKCGCGIQDEPPQSEEDHADKFTSLVKPYTPNDLVADNKEIAKDRIENNSVKGAMGNSKLNLGTDTDKDASNIDNNDGIDEIMCISELNLGCGVVTCDKIDSASVNNEINCTSMQNLSIKGGDRTNTIENYTANDSTNETDGVNIASVDASELNVAADSQDKAINHIKIVVKDDNGRDVTRNNESVELDSRNDQNSIKDTESNEEILSNTTQVRRKVDSDIVKPVGNVFKHDGLEVNLEHNIENKDLLLNEMNANNVIGDNVLHFEAEKLKTDVTAEQNHTSIVNHIDIDDGAEQIVENDIDTKNTNDISLNIARITLNDSNLKGSNDVYGSINRDIICDKDVRDFKRNINCNNCSSVDNSEVGCQCVLNSNNNSVNGNNIGVIKYDSKKSISDTDSVASVDLNTAISLINRYCGKLPSDTFTRLAPQWTMEAVELPVVGSSATRTAYICTLRLPLNCPLKYNIVGHPMPTRVLARRMVALQACRILHKSGELDNQLMPIGKENFKAAELEAPGCAGAASVAAAGERSDCARPGTTKRRQYYYKRTAWAFTDCEPLEDTSDSEIRSPADSAQSEPTPVVAESTPGSKRNMLYAIVSKLWCALPERYNTRGRRLHAPQNAKQAIGILMARHEPDNLQIPAFPVYTRSGEVRVSVEYVPDADVRLSPRRGRLVRRFMRFVFAEVLCVRRRGMKLQSDASPNNNYYIVPTIKTTREDGSVKVDIDWAFLELIYQHTEEKKHTELEKRMLWQNEGEGGVEREEEIEADDRPKARAKKTENPLVAAGETFVFDAEKYREAVVTPWYRNQDQPQFFLVAEICWQLSPDSAFPSASHGSFREYYATKYGVSLTQRDQPLLDVDHTSARLNLLTPRYVNRKGVALPVSSERTRRAKRDRLDQKQILVPELCRVHPFAAPLWFATVALPCVLYRLNALLIADEIRRSVAIDVGLGIPKITEESAPGFQWPPLDFGWSLAEVLSADSEKNEKKKEEESKKEQREKELRDKEEKEKQGSEGEKHEEQKEKSINDILQEKEDAESGFEIGTWSNEMASSIPQELEYDEYMEPLPPNLTFCTTASGGVNWCDPFDKQKNQFNPTRTFSVADSDCSFISSDLDSDDSDLDYDGTDDEMDTGGFCSSKNSNAAMGVRIEYKTAHEAEAVDVDRTKKVNPAPTPDPADDAADRAAHERLIRAGTAPPEYIKKFRDAVSDHKRVLTEHHLIPQTQNITHVLPELGPQNKPDGPPANTEQTLKHLFPYGTEELTFANGQIDLQSIERNKRVLLKKLRERLSPDVLRTLNCFSMRDIDVDSEGYVNEKLVNVGFDGRERYESLVRGSRAEKEFVPYYEQKKGKDFDFDYQPTLEGHPGPSPSVILQALTMSNANDGINLERLETIGDSFLKFAITAYLYCAHPTVHEGKLSHMRSKQVSNLNLYRLGRSKRLGARMIASKFEPHDNWLPPCHKPPNTHHHTSNTEDQDRGNHPEGPPEAPGCFIPYNLITQHSIPDKSIADCVEALIGAYLLECGPRGALLFMSWLGIRVLPCHHVPLPQPPPRCLAAQKPPAPPSPRRHRTSSSSSECSSEDDESHHQQDVMQQYDWSWPSRPVGSLRPYQDEEGRWIQPIFGELKAPPSPLLRYIEDPEGELEQMLSGYDALERTLQYKFKDRSLLLQALTHASHHSNRLTDCYQRLEFLGDAILDYLITRHLYEDPRRHSPGALTDLRSALVNNTIFATLAARHGFHKYFRHMSPGLNEVLTKYVKIQEENGHSISEEHYLIQEDEMEQAEDVEVPKALGDLFESVAGAIFLDSGMSLDAVWKSYVNLMGAELEAFSAAAPKSPVRELLEAEPDTAKFGKPERLADGRRVRVCVEVFGRGTFKGVGRNYRIAKGTAARCALRHLRPAKGK